MNLALILAPVMSLLVLAGGQSAGESHRLVLVGAGRFAVFADLSTVERRGDAVRMRALQIGEEDLVVAGELYWGGWSWWAFDCAAQTADRLDFASVRDGGVEGPATADLAPSYPAAPGGDAAELLQIACDPGSGGLAGSATVSEAVRAGREALADTSS